MPQEGFEAALFLSRNVPRPFVMVPLLLARLL